MSAVGLRAAGSLGGSWVVMSGVWGLIGFNRVYRVYRAYRVYRVRG